MDISQLASHIMQTAQSRGIGALGRAVSRAYYVNVLGELGHDRGELSLKTLDQLSDLWDSIPYPKEYDPTPTPYAFEACYLFFMRGIVDCGAVKFRATSTEFLGFDSDGQVVYSPKAGRIVYNYPDFVPAMYFIVIADEVIRPYISEFQWDKESATIKFGLTTEDIREFREVITQLWRQN